LAPPANRWRARSFGGDMTSPPRAGIVLAPMSTSELRNLLGDATGPVDQLLADLTADRGRLSVLFPGLPRRLGRQPIGGGRRQLAGATVDPDACRRRDVAAALLLQGVAAPDDELWDLWAHGDIEERAMLLRSLSFLPLGAMTRRLLDEVQRTNVVLHVEAALSDSDLLARATSAGVLDQPAGNRLLLKFAFLDLPLARAIDAERCANIELSRMLQDLATEREAAGRSVWRDTWRMLGRAPCPGALARLIGGLEHGDDGVRLAAAEGLLALPERGPGVAGFAKERLPREQRPAITALLERLSST
jgi:hypothetical protein